MLGPISMKKNTSTPSPRMPAFLSASSFGGAGVFLVMIATLFLGVVLRAEPVNDPFEPAAAPAKPLAVGVADIPPPEGPVGFTIMPGSRRQTVESFGASDAWHSDIVGRTWPEEKKQGVARLLFSQEIDEQGSPRGIGLSLWRFNIGAGSFEQGDESGIAAMGHGPGPTRVECFLSPDGTYDWTKQAGQRWFLQTAKSYGVEQFIAFTKSPPVQFTRTGRAVSDGSPRANLKPEHLHDFTRFLGEVLEHFKKEEKITFRYVSPVNEPQWKWGGGKQEGTPYTNAEIKQVAISLDAELRRRRLPTKMMLSETGDLRFVYEARGNHAGRQAHAFFDRESPDYIGNLKTLSRTFAAHSYFSDGLPDEFIGVRRKLDAELKRYDLAYAQTEYSLLRQGLDKTTRNRPIPPIDSALQLARIIHSDLVEANAVSWQFWTAMDTQRDTNFGLRFYLVERALDSHFYRPTKLLWSLGHFSRFVRPGYVRVDVTRDDGLDAIAGADRELVSAYRSRDGRELVLVAINWRQHPVTLSLRLADRSGRPSSTPSGRRFVTTADPQVNMLKQEDFAGGQLPLPARSLTTCIIPLR